MKAEVAKREIESLDYYLQNHTNDYSEESHTAMMMAIQALEQKPKSEWQQDHEILKAYSDGASAVLDKIRDEMEHVKDNPLFGMVSNDTMLEVMIEIIDKYAEEDKA